MTYYNAVMHIDSYQFGRMVINGRNYTTDCLIFGGAVHDNWFRKSGHSLSIDDLQPVIAARPSVLVIGCGASGIMRVPGSAIQALEKMGIQVEALDTRKAVERFNELSLQSANTAGAFHLTC